MSKIEIGKKCPILGEEIIEEFQDKYPDSGYATMVGETRIAFSICEGCRSKIFNDDLNSDFNVYLRRHRGLLIGHLLSTDFKDIQYRRLHFKSKGELNDKSIDLYLLIENLITEKQYPIHRKEKADNILKSLYQLQKFEGDKIPIIRSITFWGKLFLQNFEELTFFLREFESNGLIYVLNDQFGNMEQVQFTFKGLEKLEQSHLNDFQINDKSTKREYEIGLSFAGEQREYVDELANHLLANNIKVFYDNFETNDLWGKNLYQHLNDIYKNKCLYCIIFVSKEYANKVWTKHELSSAQTRAFNENKEYILPTRFDDTEIPGLDNTIGYIDLTKISPKELAEIAIKKVKSNI